MSEEVIGEVSNFSTLSKLIELDGYQATPEGLRFEVTEANLGSLLEINEIGNKIEVSPSLFVMKRNDEKRVTVHGNESNMKEKPSSQTATVKKRKTRTQEVTNKQKTADLAESQTYHTGKKEHQENLPAESKAVPKSHGRLQLNKRKRKQHEEADSLSSRSEKNSKGSKLMQSCAKVSVNIKTVRTERTNDSVKEGVNKPHPNTIDLDSPKCNGNRFLTHNLSSSSSCSASAESHSSSPENISETRRKAHFKSRAEHGAVKKKSQHKLGAENKDSNCKLQLSKSTKVSQKECDNVVNQVSSNGGTNKTACEYLSFVRKYRLEPEQILQHVNSEEFLTLWKEAGPSARLVFYHEKKSRSNNCSLLILTDEVE